MNTLDNTEDGCFLHNTKAKSHTDSNVGLQYTPGGTPVFLKVIADYQFCKIITAKISIVQLCTLIR